MVEQVPPLFCQSVPGDDQWRLHISVRSKDLHSEWQPGSSQTVPEDLQTTLPSSQSSDPSDHPTPQSSVSRCIFRLKGKSISVQPGSRLFLQSLPAYSSRQSTHQAFRHGNSSHHQGSSWMRSPLMRLTNSRCTPASGMASAF